MEILIKIESGHKPKSTYILPKTLVKSTDYRVFTRRVHTFVTQIYQVLMNEILPKMTLFHLKFYQISEYAQISLIRPDQKCVELFLLRFSTFWQVSHMQAMVNFSSMSSIWKLPWSITKPANRNKISQTTNARLGPRLN